MISVKKIRLSVAVLVGLATQFSWSADSLVEDAQYPPISMADHLAIKRTTQIFTNLHYRKIELNNAFSVKIFNRFINSLDPNHNVFLESDIRELKAQFANVLDDELLQGRASAVQQIYQVMQKRRMERYQFVLQKLQGNIPLNSDDYLEVDRSKSPFPSNTAVANDLWFKYLKNELIGLYLQGKTWGEAQGRLIRRYSFALNRLQTTDTDDIISIYLNAFGKEIDPHTSYLSTKAYKSFEESIRLSLEGIGATLVSDDDKAEIRSLIPGAPAALSKEIEVGDKIIGVGQGEDGEIEDIVGLRLDEIVSKIKGKKGTNVRLEIEPASGGDLKFVTLKRDVINLEDSGATLQTGQVYGKKIAVLKIPSFYIGLTNRVKQLLQGAAKEKIQGLVIDLRNDGGGSLAEVIDLVNLFVPDSPVVQVRNAFNYVNIYQNDRNHHPIFNGKIVVLINRNSASASEIFAAAMKDYQRAILVGQTTFGKGTVQENRGLKLNTDPKNINLGAVQYTIQKFYRINGDSTQLKGVSPDVFLPAFINETKIGEKFEDNALAWDQIAPAKFKPFGSVKIRDVDYLASRSKARIVQNPEFISLNKYIANLRQLEKKQFISLNLVKREQEKNFEDQAQLQNLNSRFRREGKPLLNKLSDLPKNYEAPDFYLEETKFILGDWMGLQ